MSKPALPLTISLLSVLGIAAPTYAQAPAPSPSEATVAPVTPGPEGQVAALEASCAASATARASRHAQTPLYQRLRGEATQVVLAP